MTFLVMIFDYSWTS